MVKRIVRVMQTLLGELFASFVFGFAVFTALIAVNQTFQSAGVLIVGVTIGFIGVAIIYSFCDITVAHFNPAITLAAIVTRRLPFLLGVGYIIAQFAGFILAGLAAVAAVPGKYKDNLEFARPKAYDEDVSRGTVFAAEFFFSAILVYVAFAVGVNPYNPPKDEHGEQLDPDEELAEDRRTTAPIAIGFTLGALALLGTGNSGGAFNPGIVLAPMILSAEWSLWYIYLLAEFGGGLVGALLQVFILYKIY